MGVITKNARSLKLCYWHGTAFQGALGKRKLQPWSHQLYELQTMQWLCWIAITSTSKVVNMMVVNWRQPKLTNNDLRNSHYYQNKEWRGEDHCADQFSNNVVQMFWMDRFARPEPARGTAFRAGLTCTIQSPNSRCPAEFRCRVLRAPTIGHGPPHSLASCVPLAVPATGRRPSPPGVLLERQSD